MDIFSNLQVVGECLLDKKRVLAFEKAVSEVVKLGDVVVDVGTGSGIIALLAARAGAQKVYAVEIAEDVAKFARRNIAASPYKEIVEVTNTDIRESKLPKGVDVVAAELLDTCLVAEQQAHAINYLRNVGVIDAHTKVVPTKLDCAVEAIEYDFNFYGFSMPFVIQARNYGANEHINKLLSNSVIYKTVDFSELVNTNVDIEVNVKILTPGLLNAIRLKSRVHLSNTVSIWGTTDMNMPVIIPIKPVEVKKGEVITLKLKYVMSEGFEKLSAEVQNGATRD